MTIGLAYGSKTRETTPYTREQITPGLCGILRRAFIDLLKNARPFYQSYHQAKAGVGDWQTGRWENAIKEHRTMLVMTDKFKQVLAEHHLSIDFIRLETIEKKIAEHLPLNRQELKLLYQLDYYDQELWDKKTDLVSKRADLRADLALALNCHPHQISRGREKPTQETICHCGDLSYVSPETDTDIPQIVLGNLQILIPIKKLPELITGNLEISNNPTLRQVVLPKRIDNKVSINFLDRLEFEEIKKQHPEWHVIGLCK